MVIQQLQYKSKKIKREIKKENKNETYKETIINYSRICYDL